jgi:hypothetical protein
MVTETLTQNSIPNRCPDFTTRPTWYINGLEKCVKIGSKTFNYIDYLEAWCSFDCNTYAPREYLTDMRKEIEAAFHEIETYTNRRRERRK